MDLIETDLDGGVMTITLADEERRNALSAQLVDELMEACDQADADPDVRVVVLTNRGTTFCAGADLAERSTATASSASRDPAELFGRYALSPKPYVGRIAGHCVAGGIGLAAALDISVAIDTARFGFPEVRIGVAPAVISVVCLPKLRPVDARAAFLRGNRLTGADAARLGLVTEAVPDLELDDRVDAIVTDLLRAAPSALAATKRLLVEVPGKPIDEAFAWTTGLSAELFAGDDATEGMRAYREKRSPSWVPPSLR